VPFARDRGFLFVLRSPKSFDRAAISILATNETIMKTHNRILYHCLCCGRVVHAEPGATIPNCCGKRMTNAAAESVVEAETDRAREVRGGTVPESPRPMVRPVAR
jgi:hypothetical protein